MPGFGTLAPDRLSPEDEAQLIDWSKLNQPFGDVTPTGPESGATLYKSPYVQIREGDINRGIDLAMGFAGGGLATKASAAKALAEAPKRGILQDAYRGALGEKEGDEAYRIYTATHGEPPSGPYTQPVYTPGGSKIVNAGMENPANPAVQTVADPQRMMFPGIYGNPREIAAEAAAKVTPEDPAMKRLFGVTRGDLRDMAEGRVGNEDPRVSLARNPRGSLAAQNLQTPRNTQRMIDILSEAGKHEGLRTADAWYIQDPMFQQMKEQFGLDEAIKRYRHLNTMEGMASPSSGVLDELQRGSAAHWLEQQGRFADARYMSVPEEFRSRTPNFPQDLLYTKSHPYFRTSTLDPMAKYLESGRIMSEKPKVPVYVHASGVPETGFQTTGPVGDAHFARGVGLADTRTGTTQLGKSISRPEYQTIQPWWQHEVAAPVGLESVAAQGRGWTVLGPQTGVNTDLGAPKLELRARQIMKRANDTRLSPEKVRDMYYAGKIGIGALGGVAALSQLRQEE